MAKCKTSEGGQRVLVRCEGAGVHYGYLIERIGRDVTLAKARRIWSWHGAMSLSEIAAKGLDLSKSKLSVVVEEIALPTAIEVIAISDTSNLPL